MGALEESSRKTLAIVDFERMAEETRKLNKKEKKKAEKAKQKSPRKREAEFAVQPNWNFCDSTPEVEQRPARL